MKSINEQIVFEDNHLLILNKLPKQLVQGDKTEDLSLVDYLKNYLKISANKPGNVFLGLTHRLDRPCSGIVVYAKTSKALERMNTIFREKQIKKTYWAVTENPPEQTDGNLKHWLKKNEKMNKSFLTEPNAKESKLAELNYSLKTKSDKYTLLEVELVTGRHHQIRAQLAAIGCPIKGDLKYGAKRSNKDGSIHLHAYSIEFLHPVKKELMRFTAMPPDESLWNFFSSTIEFPDENLIINKNVAGCAEIINI